MPRRVATPPRFLARRVSLREPSISATFVTPALTHLTHYWVRVTGSCGEVDSQTAQVVIVGGKRRAAGH